VPIIVPNSLLKILTMFIKEGLDNKPARLRPPSDPPVPNSHMYTTLVLFSRNHIKVIHVIKNLIFKTILTSLI